MELKLNLKQQDDSKKVDRVKKATSKKTKYIPSWQEVWEGYENPNTGKHKKGIWESKLNDKDKEQLLEVKQFIEEGKINYDDIEDLSKFSKTYAMSLYKKVVEIKRTEVLEEMIKRTPNNYYLVTTEEEFEEFVELVEKEDKFSLDTETTGLNFEKDHIVGFSMSLKKANKHYYIPIRHTTGEKQLSPEYVLPRIKCILENPKYKQILHNCKFDYQMFYKEDIKLANIYMDTQEAMKVLNENEMSYALKTIATKYGKWFGFNEKSSKYDELFGNGGFEGTPLKYARYYAIKDTHLTLNLSEWQETYFNKQPKLREAYFNLEHPITLLTLKMEMTGIKMDMEYATNYTKEAKKELEEMGKQLAIDFPIENINSNQQLSTFLYDELKLEDVSHKRSVDKATLKTLSSDYEPIELLLEYRKLEKLLNTFYEKLPTMVRQDGKLHPRYNGRGTVTGRLSSNDPNFQQITPKARPMFVADEGKLFVLADYSGQEVRMLAHIAQDQTMIDTYSKGLDLYSMLASKVYNKPYNECLDGSKERKLAKKIVLGNNYGMSLKSFAREINASEEEAKKVLEDFEKNFPSVKAYKDYLQDFLDKNGYLNIMGGTKRRFIGQKELARNYKIMEAKIKKCCGGKLPENLWKEKKIPYQLKQDFWKYAKDYNKHSRQCLNAVIQGSSAYQTKKAMIELDKWLDKHNGCIVAQYHDEVMLMVDENITMEEIREIEQIVIGTTPLIVPSKTDMVVCRRWNEEISVDEFAKRGLNAFDKNGFVVREM